MEAVMVKPQVKVEKLELDPTFEAGSSHTAVATLHNPTAKAFTYTTELYLGVTKEATSGVSAPFTIPAGGSTEVSYTAVMPASEGEYEVWLDVFCADAITPENPTGLVAHYQATENVVIEISPAIVIGPIIWA